MNPIDRYHAATRRMHYITSELLPSVAEERRQAARDTYADIGSVREAAALLNLSPTRLWELTQGETA